MVSFEMDEKLHVLTPFLNQSWTFCVDNKLFSSALFECYLDRFSASRIISLISDPEVNQEQRNSSKADAWILEYIAAHDQQIAIAIDGDNSGFIRISEANFTFTNRIPNGWSPPQ
jgi:carbohydrate-binding DOMON domain-containing protein